MLKTLKRVSKNKNLIVMANTVAGDLLNHNYELQKKFNEFFRQINQDGGYPFRFNHLMVHLQAAVEGKFISPVGIKMYPKFSTKKTNGGYLIELVNEGTIYETILSLTTTGGTKYALNSEVVANRSMLGIEEGDRGIIIRILEPFVDGKSNDIFIVRFDNGKIQHLKAKEIDLLQDHLTIK